MANLDLKKFESVGDGYIGYKSGSFYYSSSSDGVEVVANINHGGAPIDTFLDFNPDGANGHATSVTYSGSKSWDLGLSSHVTSVNLGNGGDMVDYYSIPDKDIRINTNGGNDWFSMGTTGGNVNVDTGTGNDYVGITIEAKGKVNINTGTGDDNVDLGNLDGETVIEAGEGNDGIYINGNVKGKTTVRAGDGNDTVRAVGVNSEDLTVDLGDGSDHFVTSGSSADIAITGSGTGAKTLQINGPVTGNISVEVGDGNDTLSAAGQTLKGSFNLGGGKDSVNASQLQDAVINLGDGNDHVNFAYSDNSSVYGGSGNDTVDVRGTGTVNNTFVDLGEGNDSLIVALTAGEMSIASGEGKDTLDFTVHTAGTVVLTETDIFNDVLRMDMPLSYGAHGSDGSVSVGSGTGVVKVAESNGYYAARIDPGDDPVAIGAWGTDSGSLIDASSISEKLVLIGTANGDATDTLIGGTKGDELVAGAGDHVFGGGGNDSILLNATLSATPTGTDIEDVLKGKATATALNTTEYVGLTRGGGKDTVLAFEAHTSSNDGDVIDLSENSISDIKLSVSNKTDLLVKLGSASLTLASINGGKAIDDVKVNVRDNTGTITTVSLVEGKATFSDVEDMSNFYYADKSPAMADFSAMDESLVVDLGNTGILPNTGGAVYTGNFTSVKGGSDTTILMGAADAKETLIAGTGDTTLWGGGSKADVLYGNKSSDTGVTYFFTAGDGRDSIMNGDWGGEEDDDVLWLDGSDFDTIKNDGKNTKISFNTGNDKLTVQGLGSSSSDTAIKFTFDGSDIGKAKVGVTGKSNKWSYDAEVCAYIGGKDNTMRVGSDVDNANIWLDGSQGVSYESVKTVNGSSSSGTLVIAGSYGDESLLAGKGETSLWGGAGNDTLQGNASGTTEFYFGKGDGSDVITSSYSDDKVMLYNVALADITSIDDSKSGVMKMTLTDGSSLTINGMNSGSVSAFQLGDGSVWQYDYASKSWETSK